MTQKKAPKDLNKDKDQKDPKSLKARVRKHLADKDDVITEEDLKNIKINTDTPEDTDQAKELAESLEDKKVGTPWNVLREDIK